MLPSVSIKNRIDNLRAENRSGVTQFKVQDKTYWLKSAGEVKNSFIRQVAVLLARYEFLSFFDTKATWKSADRIQHEKQILMHLNEKKFAAPKIVHSGEGYFATLDTGTPLNAADQKCIGQSTIDDLFMLIAELHSLKIAHGRPTLRDFVIDQNDKLFLLDFEESIIQPSNQQMARDIYILLMELSDLTFITEHQKTKSLLRWKEKTPDDVWIQFIKLSRLIQCLVVFARIVRLFKKKNRLSRQIIMTVKLLQNMN